jgi:hypothetical protein
MVPLFTVPHDTAEPLKVPPTDAGVTVTTYVPVNDVVLQFGEFVVFTMLVSVYVTVVLEAVALVSVEVFIAKSPEPTPLNVLAVAPSL